jgi:hypothetical protein
MAKDERRLTSHDGQAVNRRFRSLNKEMAAGLIDIQEYALAHGDVELAQRINALMLIPAQVNDLLDLWSANDINELIARIENGR